MSGVVSAGLGSELDRLLRQTNEQLGAAGRRVAKFIDENRQTVLASSAAALGSYIGTSDATVLRTIQALGFAGLSDLKQAILKSADNASTPADHMRRTLADLEKSTGQAVESVLQAHADGFAVLQSEKCRAQIAAAAFWTQAIALRCSASDPRRRLPVMWRCRWPVAAVPAVSSTRPAQCWRISCWTFGAATCC
jgi:hypothetical protein